MPNPFVFGLRLTAFGENAEWLNLAPVMSWAFDRTPDLEQKNQMMQQALVRAQGSSHGWHHTIQSTPGRLDLLQEAALNPFSVGRVSATMHSSTVVIAKFMEGVISHCDRLLGAHVTRLAMGATLRWQVKSPQEGAKLLHLWHAHLDVAEGDTEIIFQRNRPTSIAIASEKIKLNRIENWQVATFGFIFPPGQIPQQFPHRFWVQLTTDISTDAEYKKFIPVTEIPIILNELKSSNNQLYERVIA
jgi:hypothetical protein